MISRVDTFHFQCDQCQKSVIGKAYLIPQMYSSECQADQAGIRAALPDGWLLGERRMVYCEHCRKDVEK